MTQNFLADLKQHSKTALLNWMNFISCSAKTRKLISQEIVNFLSMIIFNLWFKCRVNLFQMKSWISLSIHLQPLQNLLLPSSISNSNRKDGAFCSIFLWNSAGNFLISPITLSPFSMSMVPMSI